MRWDIEQGYVQGGAQDLAFDLSFRHYRADAAPRHWHRNRGQLYPANPGKELEEKAAAELRKCRELYRDGRRRRRQHRRSHLLLALVAADPACATRDDTVLRDLGRRASATYI